MMGFGSVEPHFSRRAEGKGKEGKRSAAAAGLRCPFCKSGTHTAENCFKNPESKRYKCPTAAAAGAGA